MINKSSRILDFMTRNYEHFTNRDNLTTLFTALVRIKSKYNSVVWCLCL